MNLFNDNIEPFRTLGFYQPFCSLMKHGKKETRWVRAGKKPPFPLGMYLFYSTKQNCSGEQLEDWCHDWQVNEIFHILAEDDTDSLNGYAIATGRLVNIRLMVKEDEDTAFVKYVGTRTVKNSNNIEHEQLQYILEYEDVKGIEPFEFTNGKQGVGLLRLWEYEKIKYL